MALKHRMWSFFSEKFKTFPKCDHNTNSCVISLIISSICSWNLNRFARKTNSGKEEINKFIKETTIIDEYSRFSSHI